MLAHSLVTHLTQRLLMNDTEDNLYGIVEIKRTLQIPKCHTQDSMCW